MMCKNLYEFEERRGRLGVGGGVIWDGGMALGGVVVDVVRVGASYRWCKCDFCVSRFVLGGSSTSQDAREVVAVGPSIVQEYRDVLGIVDLVPFTMRVLAYDPFAERGMGSEYSLACEQLSRLLCLARRRLDHVVNALTAPPEDNGWDVELEAISEEEEKDNDGWDVDGWDMDDAASPSLNVKPTLPRSTTRLGISDPAVQELNNLQGRVSQQLARLQVFRHIMGRPGFEASHFMPWSSFREADTSSIRRVACRRAFCCLSLDSLRLPGRICFLVYVCERVPE